LDPVVQTAWTDRINSPGRSWEEWGVGMVPDGPGSGALDPFRRAPLT